MYYIVEEREVVVEYRERESISRNQNQPKRNKISICLR